MKRFALASLFSVVAANAVAAGPDAQVVITGKVIDGTCTIGTGGSSPVVITVPLSQVHNSKFTAANMAIDDGKNSFDIKLTDCPNGTTTMKWDNAANVDSATGTLMNTGGGTNAQVQLFKSDGTSAINLATDTGVSFTGATQTYTYVAKYFAKTLPVSGGDLSTFTYLYLTYN
jgi:type 1 fimbria pilin